MCMCVCFATPGSMPLLAASLAPQPGTEPVLPALGAQSLNNWTAREVLYFTIFNSTFSRDKYYKYSQEKTICQI